MPESFKCLRYARNIANMSKYDLLGLLDSTKETHAKWLALGPTLVDRITSIAAGISESLGLDYDLFLAEIVDQLKGIPGAGYHVDELIK